MKVKEIKEKFTKFCNDHQELVDAVVIMAPYVLVAGVWFSAGKSVGYRRCYNDYNALLIAQNPDAFLEAQKAIIKYNQNKK